MKKIEPLKLNDIIAPETISLWPLALGWWVLLAVIIISTIGAIFTWKIYQKRWRYRRQALQQLNLIIEQHPQNSENTCEAMHYLLKQTAMTAYPTATIAPLHQQAWRRFLNDHTPKSYFDNTLISAAFEQRYTPQPSTEAEIKALSKACHLWIKRHVQKPKTRYLSSQKAAGNHHV